MQRNLTPAPVSRPGTSPYGSTARLSACRSPWPGSVLRPDVLGFEQSAKAWLFDICPARWQSEQLFQRRPDELARLVRFHLEAQLGTIQAALRRTRGSRTSPDVQELLEVYQRESDWVVAMRDRVCAVESALQERRGTISQSDAKAIRRDGG